MTFKTLLVTAMIALLGASSAIAGEDLGQYLNELNSRIVAAAKDGREWPKYPGGLASFLFGKESVVGRSVIYYCAESSSDHGCSQWREATISESIDGTWRILAIRDCDESDARELIERRDYLRHASQERLEFDYMSQGPLDLLDLLKRWEANFWVAPILPFGWVEESDLPALVKLMISTEPCANVQNPLSSRIDPERSTVGNEAAYLIEGFRRDRYPPRLNSTKPPCDIEEIKLWWQERQGT